MIVIYLASSTVGSGKTTIAAGLGKHYTGQNKKTGYFKPVIAGLPMNNPEGKPANDADATLMRRLLSLEEIVDALSPGFKSEADLKNNIMSAFTKVAKGKDIVIVEGITGTGQLTGELARTLNAKVIGVEAYAEDYTNAAGYYSAFDKQEVFGKHLTGIILNKVPGRRLTKAAEYFTKATGVKVLGIVPEERALMSISVAELAQEIKGEIISGKNGATALIENVMLGAMVPDYATEYYGRKANKAVVLRSERPDMQLAALETSTRCLVLAGKKPPITMVTRKADDKHVPIITTEESIAGIIAAMEKALSNARLTVEKLDRAAEVVGEYVDITKLERVSTAAD